MNILLNLIMLGICLILIVLGMICAVIRKDIKQNADIIAENQQKVYRQITNIKTNSTPISDYERITINNIISALKRLETEKFVSYKAEICFLSKIKELLYGKRT